MDEIGPDSVMGLMETKAERYRQRADELRAIAAQIIDIKARETLMEVAEDYERMAQTAENTARDPADGKVDGHQPQKRVR
jgi:hypothetical protein